MTDDLLWLGLTALMTALLWLPYTLERMARVGVFGAMGHNINSRIAGFAQEDEDPAGWAVRAHAAHRNAVENLAIFAALVLAAHLSGMTGANIVLAAQVYFLARLAHFVVYTLGVPVARTLCFAAAFGAQLYLGLVVVGLI